MDEKSREEKACGLRLYVDRSNESARKTYERLGMHVSHYDLMEVEFPDESFASVSSDDEKLVCSQNSNKASEGMA